VMTGLIPEKQGQTLGHNVHGCGSGFGVCPKEFSRTTFLKGGALVIGFGLGGSLLAGKAQGATSPFSSNAPYDPTQIDSFIAIHADNTATVKSGRVELGQGTSTGLLMIAAEELNMDLAQMRWINVDTNITPDTGGTYGSSSIK